MNFISMEYVVLFAVTITMYYILPHKYRWILLLSASYCFYMFWKPSFIILLLASTGVDYYAAIKMSNSANVKERKKYLMLSLFVNLGLLGFFKYFGMLDSAASSLLLSLGIQYSGTGWNILLPIGISFYTFQTIGYSIDVYRGTIEPERHFGYFALYVSFFPQLVAGPIERASNLIPQLKKKFHFDYAQSVEGLMLICWGFFKKTVIADRLSILVDSVFASPKEFSNIHLFSAGVVFLYQLYFDFSSYTDIARGTAKILGIDLMENFKRPFAAKTISDLWSRWHISLTSWFASYLSVPLYKKYRKINPNIAYVLSTSITLSLCGLWHGADWSFLIWGLYIAVVMIMSNITRPYRRKLKSRLKINKFPLLNRMIEFITIMSTISFAMVFFRAPDVRTALLFFKLMFTPNNIPLFGGILDKLNIGRIELFIIIAGCILVETVQYLGRNGNLFSKLQTQKPMYRYAVYMGLILTILVLGKFTGSPYIYFQF